MNLLEEFKYIIMIKSNTITAAKVCEGALKKKKKSTNRQS